MAKFVLAGKTNCPYYAKAELLADRLQRSLPDFRIHKISILPDEWQDWLEETCVKNGWNHEESPLVWRELVHQGGKGVFLGGFCDFLEHCQNYYNITSDMSEELMQNIAEENLVTKLDLIMEDEHRASLVQPLHIWISSALNTTCNMLLPSLLSADVLSQASAISLHLLDLEGNEEELQSLMMETEDLALPLLHQVTIHTDLREAFQKAEIVLLLDERSLEGDPAERGQDQKAIKAVVDLYTEYGRLIGTRANNNVKVIVSGGSLVNLKCSVLLKACSIDSSHFVAVATQLENQARAAIANKLKVRTSEVTDVIVWGDVGDSFYVDLQRANVFNFDGPTKGPPFFSQPILEIVYEREWVEKDYQEIVRSQEAAVISKTGHGADMSTANGILTLLKAWNGTSAPTQMFSVGILCTDLYDLPTDVVLSVPVVFKNGRWSALPGLTVGDDLKHKLDLSASQLRAKISGEVTTTTTQENNTTTQENNKNTT
ncbi:putative malate dehydrogenase 1B isoform X2 [Corythoichthys intestinalis]|uniref:putative malate dehydrogenase 1B isoform X2 n=1 Tax=Corythoichthys intestinalis TaxID=161448 RepID=UPI0025A5A6AE|nr:putative malate dehydrogenase 1B isoform X2 [Corythoichthys intestinalis]